MYVLVSEPEPH